MTQQNQLDLSKVSFGPQVQENLHTRGGDPVVLLRLDEEGLYPVVGSIPGKYEYRRWARDGKVVSHHTDPSDIVEKAPLNSPTPPLVTVPTICGEYFFEVRWISGEIVGRPKTNLSEPEAMEEARILACQDGVTKVEVWRVRKEMELYAQIR